MQSEYESNVTLQAQGICNLNQVDLHFPARTACANITQLQASDALGLLEITKKQLQGSKSEHAPNIEAENALFKCISAYKEFVTERSIPESPETKVEYLKCLKHLLSLNSDRTTERTQHSTGVNLQDLRDEIKRLEVELSPHRKRKI